MALTFKDRVLESSISVGTGDFLLAGAQTGYQAFGVVGNGATVPYTIQGKNIDGTLTGDWEVGIGTYTLSTNSISRDTVLESSNNNALVYFPAGDKDVFLDLPGERIVQSPTTSVNSNFVAYDGVTGQLLKDSGSKASDFATSAQGAKADTAVQQSVVGQPNGVASLDAGGKVPTSQIPQMGDLNYQGTWNASTNTPTLASGTGTKGYYYVVSVSGSTNLDGITDWVVGDWAVFNGTVWQKIDNTDLVTSVNGYTGAVVLTYSDVGAQPAGSYAPATSGTSILYGNGSGGTSNVTIGSGISFAGGTLSATGLGGDVVGPASSTDNAIARFDTTTGKLLQNSVVTIDDSGNISGANSISTIDYAQLDTTAAASIALGKLRWNVDTATAAFGIIDGTTEVNIGQQMYAYVTNAESVTITAGQAVYLYQATGNRASVKLAYNTGDATSAKTLGLVTADIAAGATGFVTTQGVLAKLNTGAYAEGDTLYLGATAGSLTATKPKAPNHLVYIGVVERANNGNGQIYVRVQNGYELDEIHDVQINSPADGQTILYDASTSLWKNANLTSGTGISIANGAASVTITNSAPDQVVSLTGAGTTTVTGSYPSFTITSNDAFTGTVTSVTGTSPISVATGTTTPVVSMTQASGTTNGWLSSTDWTTFNNKQPAGTYVTAITVASANGFAGTSSGGATPALTLTTSITGMLKGNGTAISAGTAGTDYAVPSTASTWTVSQRGTVTTDNDGSFDMNVTNNFKCTLSGTAALTFTNITAGQSGYVLLVNSSGFAVTAAATTKVNSSFLATVSAAGTYLISYFTDGTNVYVTTGGAMA